RTRDALGALDMSEWLVQNAEAGGPRLHWLDGLYARLVRARYEQTLAHGLLLSGAAGIGKRVLANALAKAWLCEAGPGPAEQRPCGQCRGCGLTRVGNHPDLHLLAPAEGKSSISVDQVRELSGELVLRPHAGGHRVALVVPAQLMTLSAQNSLLKTLEEPPAGTVLVLVADEIDSLAPTIRSRCQHLAVPAPDAVACEAWLSEHGVPSAQAREALALARQAPLAALGLSQEGFVERVGTLTEDLVQIAHGRAEPVAVAGRWEKHDPHRVVDWWQGAMHALAERVLAVPPAAHATPSASQRQLADEGAAWVAAVGLFGFVDRLHEASAILRGQSNPRLLLEGLLIDWAALTRSARIRRRRAP
ncbi:MAG: DNA polymerase III subunit delta', partial [Pseudomonadota bacterium]